MSEEKDWPAAKGNVLIKIKDKVHAALDGPVTWFRGTNSFSGRPATIV